MSRHVEVIPMCTGYVHAYYGPVYVDSIYTMSKSRDMGQRMDMPIMCYLVRDGNQSILVDTGMRDAAQASDDHHSGSYLGDGMPIIEHLAAHDLTPDDIDTLVLTHLHWDHCQNMALFEKATVVVQGEELAFARNPIPQFYRTYESPALGFDPGYNKPGIRFAELNGDTRLSERVSIISTPGHSPGSQSVVVSLDSGPIVIPGDAIFCWENLIGDDSESLEYICIGRYTNMMQAWDSIGRIDRASGKNHRAVLPAHEPRVLETRSYF